MFEAKKYLIKVQGNCLYLPVAARLIWFRQERPTWGIETEIVTLDLEHQVCIFRATVKDETGRIMAQGTKMENVQGFPDYIEKSESGSIGRALAACGFGTQFCAETPEAQAGRPVDTPMSRNGRSYAAPSQQNGYASSQPRNGAQPSESPSSAADQAQAPEAEPGSDSEHACSVCGRSLTKGQELLSTRKYGVGLCPDCQKDRNQTEAAV